MTLEKIIANLESQVEDREYSADGDPESQLAKDAQVLRLVVQMLKENKGLDRGQWEGCEYCVPDCEGYSALFRDVNGKQKKMYIPEGEATIVVPGTYNHKVCISISYCPFCGKPLTEEACAELERRIGGNNETIDN